MKPTGVTRPRNRLLALRMRAPRPTKGLTAGRVPPVLMVNDANAYAVALRELKRDAERLSIMWMPPIEKPGDVDAWELVVSGLEYIETDREGAERLGVTPKRMRDIHVRLVGPETREVRELILLIESAVGRGRENGDWKAAGEWLANATRLTPWPMHWATVEELAPIAEELAPFCPETRSQFTRRIVRKS